MCSRGNRGTSGLSMNTRHQTDPCWPRQPRHGRVLGPGWVAGVVRVFLLPQAPRPPHPEPPTGGVGAQQPLRPLGSPGPRAGAPASHLCSRGPAGPSRGGHGGRGRVRGASVSPVTGTQPPPTPSCSSEAELSPSPEPSPAPPRLGWAAPPAGLPFPDGGGFLRSGLQEDRPRCSRPLWLSSCPNTRGCGATWRGCWGEAWCGTRRWGLGAPPPRTAWTRSCPGPGGSQVGSGLVPLDSKRWPQGGQGGGLSDVGSHGPPQRCGDDGPGVWAQATRCPQWEAAVEGGEWARQPWLRVWGLRDGVLIRDSRWRRRKWECREQQPGPQRGCLVGVRGGRG